MAWDLNTKALLFYITMDQVLDYKWRIESHLLNEPKDEIYVLANIIAEHDKINYMAKETAMQPNRYCFVSTEKVIEFVKAMVEVRERVAEGDTAGALELSICEDEEKIKDIGVFAQPE